MRRSASSGIFVAIILVMSSVTSLHTSPQTAPLCFNIPGIVDCLDGRLSSFWAGNGDLSVFGYPKTPERLEVNPDNGETYQTQWLERNRFELHPENSAPYDVLLGRLGVDALVKQERDWTAFPKADPAAPHYFRETGHAIASAFWSYWSSHGLEFDGRGGKSFAESLALFGMPISEAQMEGNPTNGKTYLIQWFERARFEYHPNNPGEFQVLLGLLGSEVLDCILPTITGCRELARQPGSALYIQDSDDARLSQLAGDRSAQPTWLISQWGIPTDLTGSQTAAPTTNWQIANPYGRVNYLANVNIYELGQNGQNAELPCGTEYDLFLSPVGQNFPNLPQGNSASRTLDKLDTLAFQIGAKVTYESITSRCRPLGKVDYAHYAISFVLSSTTQQTLFYQIGLRTSGLNYGPANMAWCPDYNDSRTAHQFCADDDISSVNSSLQDLTVGQRIQYATDMLPRLKQVLQSGFGKVDGERLDGNISHWKLTGVYFGLIIQGGANIASQWDSFLLIEK